MEYKTCLSCSESLPVTSYHKDKSRKTGLRETCKTCRCKHPEGSLEKQCLACNDTFSVKSIFGKAQKYCGKTCQTLHIRYGISEYEYEDMLLSCDNKCMICGEQETSKDKRTGKTYALAVDHCHTTGKVRGLLCASCNTAIGLFKDNVDKLKNAISYLNNAKEEYNF